jgi:hypothetical protein
MRGRQSRTLRDVGASRRAGAACRVSRSWPWARGIETHQPRAMGGEAADLVRAFLPGDVVQAADVGFASGVHGMPHVAPAGIGVLVVDAAGAEEARAVCRPVRSAALGEQRSGPAGPVPAGSSRHEGCLGRAPLRVRPWAASAARTPCPAVPGVGVGADSQECSVLARRRHLCPQRLSLLKMAGSVYMCRPWCVGAGVA